MTLTLDIVSVEGQSSGETGWVFTSEGGTIGRNPECTWVLSNAKVSGRHALIRYQDGVFYIEDMSRNGVCLNGLDGRLEKGRQYELSDRDVLYIDPYEIRVTVSQERVRSPQASRRGGAEDWPGPRGQYDPFSDPFAPAHEPERSPLPEEPEPSRADLDPLKWIGPAADPPRPKGPTAEGLDGGAAWNDYYRAPDVVQPPSPSQPPRPADLPPPNYNPANSKIFQQPIVPAPRPTPGHRPSPPSPPARSAPVPDAPKGPPFTAPAASAIPPPVPRSGPISPAVQAPMEPAPAADLRRIAPAPPSPASELAALLAGAGLDPSLVTPELAGQIGAILRVVVDGVMKVLQARADVKDAFDVKRTVFRPMENNPLKFSANVEDALHNLLVKRNPAYLGPVDAFEDAFEDLRQHQVAMLAGIRVAFEALLAEFDPEHLQAEFDKVPGKGLVPTKLRYWELYKERAQALVRDPDATFKRLFAEAFARAYADQLAAVRGGSQTSDETGAFHARRDDRAVSRGRIGAFGID